MGINKKCLFAKGSCKTCGRSESVGLQMCYYDDPFWFKEKKKKPPIDNSICIIIPFKKSIRSSISKKDRAFIYERDGYKCLACGSYENETIDHIIPLSKGGKNVRDNYQLLCQKCNSEKGSRIKNYVNL